MNLAERDFELLSSDPSTETGEIPKPYLSDKRQVKLHLQAYLEDTCNSRFVTSAIKQWRSGGVILRARHPKVNDGRWNRLDVTKRPGAPQGELFARDDYA